MRLDLNRSKDSLSLVAPVRVLEPVWIVVALFLFFACPKQGMWMALGVALLGLSFLQRKAVTGCLSRSTACDVPWALLLAGALISLWASYDAGSSLKALLVLIGSVALYYAAANAPQPRMLAQAVVLIGLAGAVYFLTQYQYIPHAEKSGLASAIGRITSGPFPRLGSWQPFSNGVATLLEGLIPLGVALTLTGRSWTYRVLSGATTGILGIAVLATASRGAWVSLLAAGALWLASRRRGGIVALAVVTIAVCAVAGGYLYLAEGATLTDIPVVGSAAYQLFARPDRLQVYHGSLRLIQDFPLTGIGLGEVFPLVYAKYVLLIPHPFLSDSHNLYLSIWLGHGLLGVVGIGWLAVVVGSLIVRESRKGHPTPLFQAAWVGVVATLIHGLFDGRQYVDLWSMWPLFVLLGLMVACSTVAAQGTAGKRQRMARWGRWRWVALILLMAGCAVVWRSLLGVTYANLGAVKQAKAELGTLSDDATDAHLRAAMADYERALQANPDNRTANLRLGNLAVADGRYEEGVTHLEAVWQAAPDDRTARKALGLACAWVGEIDRAAELLKDTKDIVVELNIWGWWHGQEGRPQAAMNAYRTSLALQPDQPKVQHLLVKLESE